MWTRCWGIYRPLVTAALVSPWQQRLFHKGLYHHVIVPLITDAAKCINQRNLHFVLPPAHGNTVMILSRNWKFDKPAASSSVASAITTATHRDRYVHHTSRAHEPHPSSPAVPASAPTSTSRHARLIRTLYWHLKYNRVYLLFERLNCMWTTIFSTIVYTTCTSSG